MSADRLFVESSLRQTVRFTPEGGRTEEDRVRRGVCLEEDVSPSGTAHVAADGTELLDSPPHALPPGTVTRAREVLAHQPCGFGPRHTDLLAGLAAESGAVLTLAGHEQRVLAGSPERPVADTRTLRTVEVELPGAGSEVFPWPAPDRPSSDPAPAAVSEAVRNALEALRARTTLPPAELPDPVPELVLLPGRAGAFFHELVGHPLEGDVVASGTGYLAKNARVAPEWLTVDDGAAHGGHGFRARFDDQGTPTSRTPLIREGRLRGPLNDLATARLTGTPPTGNGRRLDYGFPAVPRMTHTRAFCARPGTLPEGPWIAPLGLSLERMGIATGEFVFVAHHPLLYSGRSPAARLPRLRISGSAGRVLAGLRPGPGGLRGYTRASKGCGKLGQFPLIVSFANSGLRLPAGLVEVTPDV
ncbi:metallopeptidase TldD-related protein [Nocardiopsis alba]|uniref:metallopeptidase TldD-related protein n=1 Tax=Nocardiopsis alba TaxID=53437 RepID=UPI0036695092